MRDTLDVMSGKWKLVILAVLLVRTYRFKELSREIGISPRVLAKELQQMEQHQLVTRTVCASRPVTALYPAHTAAARVTSLFVELPERQFPIETPQQRLRLRTATDYAARLAVHVNHLNKVLKETTGRTTTDLIGSRVMQEAKLLLKQTNWNVSEIADSLGFAEVAHFSNFFKRQTALSPAAFRSA